MISEVNARYGHDLRVHGECITIILISQKKMYRDIIYHDNDIIWYLKVHHVGFNPGALWRFVHSGLLYRRNMAAL